MTKNLVRTMALVAAVGVAACGDDDGPTATGDTLSETEVAALSGIIVEQAFGATASAFGGIAPAAVDGPQLAPFTYSTDISTTVSCDRLDCGSPASSVSHVRGSAPFWIGFADLRSVYL